MNKFDEQHLRLLRDAAIWDMPKQMAYLEIPGDPILVFPEYFLQVETGKVIREIEHLPNQCAVLLELQRVVREQLPIRDPEDHLELVYTSRETNAFITNSPRQVAHALCAPCYVGHYQEVAGTGSITLREDWFFRPDKVVAEIIIYPKPYHIEVWDRWVPDASFPTLEWDIKVLLDDNYLIIINVNGQLRHIAWLTLPDQDD